MEARLRALKVVDLKTILATAQIPLPTKANKPELIAKILDSQPALDVYEQLHGSGNTPRPASTPQPPASTTKTKSAPPDAKTDLPSADDQNEQEAIAENTDLLAPPEDFDWSASAVPAVTSSNSGISLGTNASAPAPAEPSAADSATIDIVVASAANAKTESAEPSAAPAEEEEDEETKKRRARAARFGIPFVEKPKPKPQQQQQKKKERQTGKKEKNGAVAAAAVVNTGKKSDVKAATKMRVEEDQSKLAERAKRFGTTIPAATNGAGKFNEDPEKLKQRAARFGPSVTNEPAKTQAKTKTGGTAEKRAAEVDPEEAERRRKRAERFGAAAAEKA